MNRKQRIAGLLQRFEFTDFASIVSEAPSARKDKLRAYVDRDRRGRWKSYKGFRAMVPDIAGAKRGLDLSDPLSIEEIARGLKSCCHPDDYGRNLDAAKAMFNFVRPQRVDAYCDHPRSSLLIGPDRRIPMGVEHYVVSGDRGYFRWVYPRQNRLLGDIPRVAMSLIYHNFVRGDFADFGVEMIDLSCDVFTGPRGGVRSNDFRSPRSLVLSQEDVMGRQELNREADTIYGLLMELSEET